MVKDKMNDLNSIKALWEEQCCSGNSWYRIAENMKDSCLKLEQERDELNLYIDECKDSEIRWRKCTEELAKHLSRWYPSYGFCVDNEASIALRNFEKLKENENNQ